MKSYSSSSLDSDKEHWPEWVIRAHCPLNRVDSHGDRKFSWTGSLGARCQQSEQRCVSQKMGRACVLCGVCVCVLSVCTFVWYVHMYMWHVCVVCSRVCMVCLCCVCACVCNVGLQTALLLSVMHICQQKRGKDRPKATAEKGNYLDGSNRKSKYNFGYRTSVYREMNTS